MEYAKIVDGGVVRVGSLPRNLKTETNTIVNFNKLSDTDLATYGYLPIIDETPAHDSKYTSKGTPEYVVGVASVVLSHVLSTTDLLDYKQQAIQKVYQAAKQEMDAQTIGYSLAEVATWPAIQADVIAYNATTAIGAALQQAADTSAYTAAEVAAIITPKIAVQIAALSKRATLVTSINAAVDHAAVSLLGW